MLRGSASLVLVGAAVVLLAMPAASAAGVAAPRSAPGSHGAVPFVMSVTSTDWAGYLVLGANHSVTWVNGSWLQPNVTKCPANLTELALIWVGMDGGPAAYTTVERVGTGVECVSGAPQYFAWYQLYPANSGRVRISGVTIHAGDTIFASVHYDGVGARFHVQLTDKSTRTTFRTSGKVNGAVRDAAEWIVQDPSVRPGTPYLLPAFGIVKFGKDATGVAGTDTATISGTNGGIGSFPSSSVGRFDLGRGGGVLNAVTSTLTTDGLGFNVAFLHH